MYIYTYIYCALSTLSYVILCSILDMNTFVCIFVSYRPEARVIRQNTNTK